MERQHVRMHVALGPATPPVGKHRRGLEKRPTVPCFAN